jgi:hypothetical protein
MWDLFISHPLPVLGKPEPIFPENALGHNDQGAKPLEQ